MVRTLYVTEHEPHQHSRVALHNTLHTRLAARGIEYIIVAVKPLPGPKLPPSMRPKPTVIRLWEHSPPRLRALDADHFLIGGYGSALHWRAWLTRLRSGVPFTFWGGTWRETAGWQSQALRPLKRWFVTRARNCVAYGTRSRAWLIRLGARPDRVRVGYNVSDLDFFRQVRRRQTASQAFLRSVRDRRRVRIIYAGRMVEGKGLENLRPQIDRLPASRFEFRFAGGGLLAPQIAQFAADRPHVMWLGLLDRERLARELVAADVFVYPSHSEVFSRGVGEALACGCFVLTSILDDVSFDFVRPGVNGLIFDPRDPDDFAAALGRVTAPSWQRPDRDAIDASQPWSTANYAGVLADAITEALTGRV